MKRIADLINHSTQCSNCKGSGKVENKPCPKCNGSGVQIDNRIPNIILKYYPKDRATMAKCVEDIYKAQVVKIEEAYNRGKLDGEAIGADILDKEADDLDYKLRRSREVGKNGETKDV